MGGGTTSGVLYIGCRSCKAATAVIFQYFALLAEVSNTDRDHLNVMIRCSVSGYTPHAAAATLVLQNPRVVTFQTQFPETSEHVHDLAKTLKCGKGRLRYGAIGFLGGPREGFSNVRNKEINQAIGERLTTTLWRTYRPTERNELLAFEQMAIGESQVKKSVPGRRK